MYKLLLILVAFIAMYIFWPEKVVSQTLPEPQIETVQILEPEPIIKKTVEEQIEEYAEQYNLDPNLMKRIAKAESQFKNKPNYLYDGENGRYTAYGIFQITRTTWKEYCGTNVSGRMENEKNIECAMKIASESGVHHWNESKHKWK